MRKVMIIFAALVAAGTAFGQTTQDPAVQEMKEKLEVVYDLGRMFGYIQTMDKEQKKLALSTAQAKALAAVADKVLKTVRFEPKEAEALLVEIEDKILKPDQLMFVDGLAIARATERTATSGTGAGSAGGTSPVQSYMNGGPFNPMKDTTKKIGQDFKAAYDYLKAKK
jgi:hypothetical protein